MDLPFDQAQGGELVEPFRASCFVFRILDRVLQIYRAFQPTAKRNFYGIDLLVQGGYLQMQLPISRTVKLTEEYSLPGAQNQTPTGHQYGLG